MFVLSGVTSARVVIIFCHPRMRLTAANTFGHVCLSVCPAWVLLLEALTRNFIFGMQVHIQTICVIFICQGH